MKSAFLTPQVKSKTLGPTNLSPETLAHFKRVAREIVEAPTEIAEKVRAAEPRKAPIRTEKNRKFNLKTGMIFGDLILRRKAAPNKGAKPTLRERWTCECMAKGCGNKIIVPKYYLIRKGNPKTHCGCRFATLKSLNQREYRIYHMMHQRCMNPNHESYEHYKKRGITIYEPWQKHNEDGFELWFKEIGKAPGPGYSLDRINNAKGYIPGNIRWSNASDQRINQGDLIGGKTSKEIEALGMTEDEWVAYCRINGYQ